MSCVRTIVLGFVVVVSSHGASIRQLSIGATAEEQNCSIGHPHESFDPGDRQAFVRFVVDRLHAGDRLTIEWLDPSGAVSATVPYTDLPAAGATCFIAQLPIAGFPPASQPGRWSIRVVLSGTIAAARDFTISGVAASGGPQLAGVSMRAVDPGIELVLHGAGFTGASVVHLAQFAKTGGWTYIAALLPVTAREDEIVVRYTALAPAEYMVIVRNPDDRLSSPARLLISTGGGYKLPTAAGEQWVITQGPYGSFSHWNNSLHAYDIAPRSGRYVVAMRSGIAHPHDLGLGQTPNRRTFGNYITIDHGDGEYSHYAHLASGTFLVKDGQQVEQGQTLARVGNSGYTLGEDGGYHVHVHVTRSIAIASPSIPFRFEDLPSLHGGPVKGLMVSSNNTPTGAPAPVAAARKPVDNSTQPLKHFSGNVQVSQWWSDLVPISKEIHSLSVALSWADAANDLDLHLVSPSGRHYGWYGETSGYSGPRTRPERFQLSDPEPGIWRISVQGMQGPPGPISFEVDATVVPAARTRTIAVRRRR